MIVYSGTKSRFHQDVLSNDIGNIIYNAFQGATGRRTNRAEINSWTNSLMYMHNVLEDPAIPADAGVAIEYHIPRSSKRIDFILTGTDAANADTAVLVELKQWQQATLTAKDAVVVTPFSGKPQETAHPSYQAWSYKRLLQDYNATVQEEHINLYPCAYLHNYEPDNVITNPFYGQYTKEAPVFLKPDAVKLQVRPGFRARHNYASRPGRKAGGDFSAKIAEAGSRTTAMRSMRDFITRNSAPRLVYEAKLAGTMRRSRISNLFSGSGSYHDAEPNTYDCLLVDEVRPGFRARHNYASRPGRKTGGDFSAKIAEVGSRKTAMRFMRDHRLKKKVTRSLSPGYLAWLDNALQVATTANDQLDTRDYDFKVLGDPAQLHALIRQKNLHNNKARVVAGYCWPWLSKKDPGLKDIVIGAYQARWNLNEDGQTWIIQPDSVSEVGCIHTCQGLELDYVGVIVGPDLIVRNGEVVTSPEARARTDKSLHGWRALHQANPAAAKKRLDLLIKNTYRTLMTRGHNPNPALRRIPREAGGGPSAMRARPDGVYASRRAPAMRAESCSSNFQAKGFLPVLSLEAACGAFGRGMAVEPQGWAKCPPGLKPDRNMFVARVSGRSMEPRLHHGDYCVFRANVAGTRQNKLVLVQHSGICDPDTGGSYTVKKYTSKKKYAEDGAWQHEEIILKPLNPEYADIVIPNAEDEEFMVVAEVVGKCAT